ncbi:MAG: endonuclease/exonuclease/phosphatase family protein, partial [Fidelibacterota bacterium]
MSRSIRTLAAVLLLVPALSRASPGPYDATIMTYNLWNYMGTSAADNAREDDLAAVILSVAPDILVAQEINGTVGYSHFLDDVLNQDNPDMYRGAPFINQDSTDFDIALYYDPDVFSIVSTREIELTSEYGQRDGVEFVMEHLSTGTELIVYGVHLKAGSGFFDPEDEEEREAEASMLRDYLNELDPSTFFLVAGDYNVYRSDEGAFQRLTESQQDNDGRLFDPINRPGEWHDNSSFADIHTQSSRGDFGGLDDRFDFLLVSSAVMDTNDVNVVP